MKKMSFYLLMIFSVAVSTNCTSAERKEKTTYTDPANAGADYKIQGEYVGKGRIKYGVQVIALGDGKFRAEIYRGGLPGDGWKRGMQQSKDNLQTKNGVVSGARVTIKNDVLFCEFANGRKRIELKKVNRKSPTLGAKPPKGATVLFDGSTAKNFEGGKLTKDKFLAANTFSKLKCGDCKIHLEFRTPFKPKARGQDRGNSGIYIQSRYECQILDSFGLSGENNECGGFYKVKKPKVNMCYPPLTWQTYDIDFTAAVYKDGKKIKNAKAIVKHNGVLIHKDLEIPKDTPGRQKEANTPAPIMYLQGHGNPVVYQNIWIVEK